ncbi:hypothetical protein PILCRDRAFT_507132 [Piloderma croceum F 1598]|uniref:Uncharacterized protein n=1 Tax=Piloderma croceum (strain F 1598) TaxID=765440 RepID=A0A0C3FNG8_PILCF|nr:hypothetical protein PILCRDRAFT_507132 [Piloderma croceum F 1598]
MHIQGSPNIPKHGPLILASNEIIDIAVLAIMIPHLRPISFWTMRYTCHSFFPAPRTQQINNPGPEPSLYEITFLALHRG